MPEDWGPRYVKMSPFESDPGTWAELDRACSWGRVSLPADVLTSLSRYSELPATDDKGPVRMTAVVTVHRTPKGAERELDSMLKETLDCPEQQLGGGEKLSGLLSAIPPQPVPDTDETLQETGQHHAADGSGPHYYHWWMMRRGPVTVTVTVSGGAGHSKEELRTTEARTAAVMVARLAGESGESGEPGGR